MNDKGVLTADDLIGAVPAHGPLTLAPPFGEDLVAPAIAHVDAWLGKRVVDIVGSVVLLLLALPIFLAVSLLIRLTAGGPVLFRQQRVGRGGKEFRMLKFRTMHVNSESRLQSDPHLQALFLRSAHKIPSHLDPRITSVGRVLRRLSLDELPQLLNVLSGQMSLVGPRPVERSQLVHDYEGYENAYLALRPGLTGLWQVSGRSKVQFPERAEMDRDYLRTCGPWVDAKIILRTPIAIVAGLGAD